MQSAATEAIAKITARTGKAYIETGTDSYRLAQTRAKQQQQATAG